MIRLDRLEALLDERTALLALMLANNETGVVQPVAAAAALAHAAGALMVVDAVQAAGKIAVDRARLGADYLAVSAHKLGGPQGVGALLVRPGAPLLPLVHGGGQERGLRSGTENAAGIAGFGAAAAAALAGLAAEASRVAALRRRLERGIAAIAPGARSNGGDAPERLPGTVSATFPGADAGSLVVALDLLGVAVSTGSACASGAAEPSHVLAAMGLDATACSGTVRFSLGWDSSEEDVDRALAALAPALARQHAGGRVGAGGGGR